MTKYSDTTKVLKDIMWNSWIFIVSTSTRKVLDAQSEEKQYTLVELVNINYWLPK